MSTTLTLELSCQVTPPTPASVTITVDGIESQFQLEPTIDWVASSTAENSRKIEVPLEIDVSSPTTTFDFKIKSENSDLLICGYKVLGYKFVNGVFHISSQPIWDVPGWQPYDISGHEGDNAQYQGNGSLQVLAGQTVEFAGLVILTNTST